MHINIQAQSPQVDTLPDFFSPFFFQQLGSMSFHQLHCTTLLQHFIDTVLGLLWLQLSDQQQIWGLYHTSTLWWDQS